jgi:hypothetical protein
MRKVEVISTEICHEVKGYNFGIWNLLGPVTPLFLKLIGEGNKLDLYYKRGQEVTLSGAGEIARRFAYSCPVLKQGECGKSGLACKPEGVVTVIEKLNENY